MHYFYILKELNWGWLGDSREEVLTVQLRGMFCHHIVLKYTEWASRTSPRTYVNGHPSPGIQWKFLILSLFNSEVCYRALEQAKFCILSSWSWRFFTFSFTSPFYFFTVILLVLSSASDHTDKLLLLRSLISAGPVQFCL